MPNLRFLDFPLDIYNMALLYIHFVELNEEKFLSNKNPTLNRLTNEIIPKKSLLG